MFGRVLACVSNSLLSIFRIKNRIQILENYHQTSLFTIKILFLSLMKQPDCTTAKRPAHVQFELWGESALGDGAPGSRMTAKTSNDRGLGKAGWLIRLQKRILTINKDLLTIFSFFCKFCFLNFSTLELKFGYFGVRIRILREFSSLEPAPNV